MATVRRAQNRLFKQATGTTPEWRQFAVPPQDMFDPRPPDDNPLPLAAWDALHLSHCPICAQAGAPVPDCYWASLRMCLSHGFLPVTDGLIVQQYAGSGPDGNHASTTSYADYVRFRSS